MIAPRKIFLALASSDWRCEVHTAKSIREAQRASAHRIEDSWVFNDGVARARNNLAWEFIESGADFLFFIDSDISFDPVHIDRLVAHDLPIVGGLYPKKQGKLSYVATPIPGEEPHPTLHLMKTLRTGTGFLCIRRDVVETIRERMPSRLYRGDPFPDSTRLDLFPMHAEGGEYRSEDWFFCHLARQCGYDVLVDVSVCVRHVGKIVYPLHETLSSAEVIDICAHHFGRPAADIAAFFAVPNAQS